MKTKCAIMWCTYLVTSLGELYSRPRFWIDGTMRLVLHAEIRMIVEHLLRGEVTQTVIAEEGLVLSFRELRSE